MPHDPKAFHSRLMREMPFDMRLKEGENVSQWQERARAKLGELLGYPYLTPDSDNLQIEWTKTDDARFDETRFSFDSEPGYSVPCHLLLPKGKQGPLPLVICLQGHTTGMHISMGRPMYEPDAQYIFDEEMDYAVQAVELGFAALCIEQRAFGECGGSESGPQCHIPATQALLLGRTMVGERCWDVSRSIDIVEKYFPIADMSRIALIGISGGGTIALYAAAMETRIAASMPMCYLCGFQASIGEMWHCLCSHVSGIMKHFDMGDIAGLVAPRPQIVVNGSKDVIFPVESAREQAQIAQRAYDACGASDMFKFLVGEGGHRCFKDLSWPAFREATGWH